MIVNVINVEKKDIFRKIAEKEEEEEGN